MITMFLPIIVFHAYLLQLYCCTIYKYIYMLIYSNFLCINAVYVHDMFHSPVIVVLTITAEKVVSLDTIESTVGIQFEMYLIKPLRKDVAIEQPH